MLPRRQPPTQARYLRARLRTFTKPAFWGSALFLSVVGVGIWQYWTNPGLMKFFDQQVADSSSPTLPSLSKEDKAIGADIDNLSVLNQEFNRGSTLATPNDPNEKPESVGSKGLLDEATLKKLNAINSDPKFSSNNQTPPITTSKLENPFLNQAQYLLQAGSINNTNSAKPLTETTSPILAGGNDPRLGMRFSNSTNPVQSTTPISASQGVFNPSQSVLTNSNNQTSQFVPTNTSNQTTFGQTQNSIRPEQVAPTTNNQVGMSGGTAYNQPPAMNSSQTFYSNLINQSSGRAPTAPAMTTTPIAPNLSPLPIVVPSPARNIPVAPGVYGAGAYSPYNNSMPSPPASSNYSVSTPVAPSNYNNSIPIPVPVAPNYNNSTQPIPPQPQQNIFPRGQ